ncbi:diguanylate cyclase (GGDEF) domain-containing protein [Klenkia marina]|uniref:Diguanylate cyclase (GGDEF) domain-containing protein n=1 Tax=Klenkia marina TaxID=1960309 RepID=A0A1G4YSV0_9ACTN|nr:bifunctional diguanylate cyclase/phosphodiesterase [Klenkia marina]SCX56527.1 diguanylate cyclase (GGDEF) domain-containing protein [Klenkia marina]
MATPRAVAATMSTSYLVGGLAGLCVVAGSRLENPRTQALLVLSLTALVGAGIIRRWGNHWRREAVHAPLIAATCLISCAVLIAPDPVSAMVAASLMSFLVLDAFLFVDRLQATGHALLALSGITAVLVARDGVPLATVLGLDAILIALGVVTSTLVARASAAERDPLTDLLNRRGFDRVLHEEVACLPATGGRLSVALLDLDHFDQLNETLGAEAGDRVLRQVADTWRRGLPPRAVLARYGGDEFAVLLPGATGQQAWALVESVRTGRAGPPLSGGVAEYVLGDSVAQVVRRAEQALFAAKSAGRDRCTLDGDETPDLVRDLAAALDAGDLRTHFQPILQLSDDGDTVVGAEVLVRWDRPGHGPVPAQDLVAVAEEHGLVGRLGETVLRSACSQLAELHATTGRRLRLGINVSGLELADPGYPERVCAVLTETGWPASETVIEVTETVLDADSFTSVASLHALRAMGVLVSIDDFGTGYSSLARLDTLPADILKVDAAFTASITTSPRRAQMLRSVAGLAAALGLDVVAEGVETEEQLELVRRVGCTYAQGWLPGRPSTLPDLVAALDRPGVARPI